MKIEVKLISKNGFFPNNAYLPLLLYKEAVDVNTVSAEVFESHFSGNGWRGLWRDSIYSFHHYHSNTHEVLGIYSGSCNVQVGGDKGDVLRLKTGDALIIPVGVAHKNIGCTSDFQCVGAYPFEIHYDMNYGKEEEEKYALKNIQNTPFPKTDPLFGKKGPLFDFWKF